MGGTLYHHSFLLANEETASAKIDGRKSSTVNTLYLLQTILGNVIPVSKDLKKEVNFLNKNLAVSKPGLYRYSFLCGKLEIRREEGREKVLF